MITVRSGVLPHGGLGICRPAPEKWEGGCGVNSYERIRREGSSVTAKILEVGNETVS